MTLCLKNVRSKLIFKIDHDIKTKYLVCDGLLQQVHFSIGGPQSRARPRCDPVTWLVDGRP